MVSFSWQGTALERFFLWDSSGLCLLLPTLVVCLFVGMGFLICLNYARDEVFLFKQTYWKGFYRDYTHQLVQTTCLGNSLTLIISFCLLSFRFIGYLPFFSRSLLHFNETVLYYSFIQYSWFSGGLSNAVF